MIQLPHMPDTGRGLQSHYGAEQIHLAASDMHIFHAFRTLLYHATAVADEHCGAVGWLIEQM